MADTMEVISREHLLNKCWHWTLTNTELQFKNYYRYNYNSYALSAAANLRDLRTRLRSRTYSPDPAIKVYAPKPSGGLRAFSLLSVEDQVVYLSCATIVAQRLHKHVARRYENTVFGNLYAGTNSDYFYKKWQTSYTLFSNRIRRIVDSGYVYGASFDLTACYDTIDHSVLAFFLTKLKFDPEFIEFLCHLLAHWTAVDSTAPLKHGHGIPQGPLPSGLIAEVVLKHFDECLEELPGIRYVRYVDDIRLYAKDERTLRSALVRLELASKHVGLFPQSHKINVRHVSDSRDEIKTISTVIPIARRAGQLKSTEATLKVLDLTRLAKVDDVTKFKYILPHAKPSAKLDRRLLAVLEAFPHLFLAIMSYFSSQAKLSEGVSSRLLDMIELHEPYPSVVGSIVNVLRDKCHPSIRDRCSLAVRKLLFKLHPWQWEERHAATAYLLTHNLLQWDKIEAYVSNNRNWYSKSNLLPHLGYDMIGRPSFDDIVNRALRDEQNDVAVAASHVALVTGVIVQPPIVQVNKIAQHALFDGGVIGSKKNSRCHVKIIMGDFLGESMKAINWRKVLGPHYKLFLRKLPQWRSYSSSDPNAFVNITDTLCDLLVDALFTRDERLGNYQLGNPGGILGGQPGAFGTHFPRSYLAFKVIHKMRLESDLSHPTTKSGRPTRRIKYRELGRIRSLFYAMVDEIWKSLG